MSYFVAMRLGVIINPIAGTRAPHDLAARIEDALPDDVDLLIEHSQEAGHATQIAHDWIGTVDRLAVAGGDGSVSEVARALVGTDLPLGILPFGSGNGLAWHFHIPTHSIERALQVVLDGHPLRVDTGHMAGQPFVSTAGTGIEAYAAHLYRQRGQRGFMGYATALAGGGLFRFQPTEVSVQVDGESVFDGAVSALTVFNSSVLGFNVKAVPTARMTDGFLDLFLVPAFPRHQLPLHMARLAARRAERIPGTIIQRCRSVRIESPEEMIAQRDGDAFRAGRVLEIGIEPVSLILMVPRDHDEIE